MTSNAPSPRSRPSSVTGIRRSSAGPIRPSSEARLICRRGYRRAKVPVGRRRRVPLEMTATPASHPFEIREHDADGVHVIAMRGELDLATAPQLCVRIDAARRGGSRRMVVDLTTAEFCDSAGLRALIGSNREMTAFGGRMAVAAQEESAVGRLFGLAGARELLNVHEDAGAAVAALALRTP